MIYPIVRPKDFLETALSFPHLFIRPLWSWFLFSPPGPCFSLYQEGMRERDDAAGYTPYTYTRAAMRQQEMEAASSLPVETSFRNSAQSSLRERN